MLDIFSQLLDTIFPPRSAIKLLRHETKEQFVSHFSPCQHLNTIALSSYDDPIIRAAITTNKFNNYEPAANLLATLINHWHQTMPEANTIYVPIPLSKERERSRGYNQVTRIIASTELKTAALLKRQRHTRPQTSLNRAERFNNMHDAFTADIPKNFTYQRIVIIDDVVTTGATLRAAEAALKEKLPKECEVVLLAIAH